MSSLEIALLHLCLLSLIAVAAGSPAHWEPIDPAHGHKTLVLLSKDNPKHKAELAAVHENWTRTAGDGTIVSVHRVQNLRLWSAYEAMKAQLQKSGSLVQSDAIVWHGSRTNPPELIHAEFVGFDPLMGVSHAGSVASTRLELDSPVPSLAPHLRSACVCVSCSLCWFAEQAYLSSSAYYSVVSSSTLPFRYRSGGDGGCMPSASFKQIFQAQITLTPGQVVGQVRDTPGNQ